MHSYLCFFGLLNMLQQWLDIYQMRGLEAFPLGI